MLDPTSHIARMPVEFLSHFFSLIWANVWTCEYEAVWDSTCSLTRLHSDWSSRMLNAAPQMPPVICWHCVVIVMRPASVVVKATAMPTPAARTSVSLYVHSGVSQWKPDSPTESTVAWRENNQFRGQSCKNKL